MIRRLLCALFVSLFLLVSCSPTESQDSDAGTVVQLTLPDTPEGDMAQRLVKTLSGGVPLTADDVHDMFQSKAWDNLVPEFPAAELEKLRSLGPWRATSFIEEAGLVSLAIKNPTDTEVEILFGLGAQTSDPRITRLWVHPAVTSWPGHPASLAELELAVQSLPVDTTLLVSRLDVDGEPKTILDVNATRVMAMGSASGIYSVAALASTYLTEPGTDGTASDGGPASSDASAASDADSGRDGGEASTDLTAKWEQRVIVPGLVRKLTSGPMAHDEESSSYTLRQILTQYLRDGDTTSADLLQRYVGQAGINGVIHEIQHRNAAALEPFLSQWQRTFLAQSPTASDWSTLSTNAKQQLLQRITSAQVAEHDMQPQLTEPVWHRGLDWSATAYDVADLYQLAMRGPAMFESSADGQGAAAAAGDDTTGRDAEVWAHAWQGSPGALEAKLDWDLSHVLVGQAPGVYAVNWLVADADGGYYLVVARHQSTDLITEKIKRELYNIAFSATDILSGEDW